MSSISFSDGARDQHQGNGDAVAANAGQVVQAGVGDLRDAAADHCSRHLGGATCRFADARHLNTLGIGRFDEDARILFDTTQVDGDGRSGHDLPVFSEGGSRSGHSRPDGWRELDNFAPTVVSQDTYVQYEDYSSFLPGTLEERRWLLSSNTYFGASRLCR